jgi:peptidoglycan-N-acetylglucosamine deacetylase
MKKLAILLLLAGFSITWGVDEYPVGNPGIAFSFDDGTTNDINQYKGEVWTGKIIEQLSKNHLQAVLFARAKGLDNPKGRAFLKQWDQAGNLIANHTYNHYNYNDTSMTCQEFIRDIEMCDLVISGYKNYRKIFRFPFLKAGNTLAKRDSICNYLADHGYKQGWVTIDNSDWYICSRMVNRLKQDPNADLTPFRDFYINHIFERAVYYNKMAVEICHRQIRHTLLLHINLSSALFLQDLIDKFKKEGWIIENYSTAILDPVYQEVPSTMPSDQSLIWSLARKSGRYNNILRYPGEDGDYEKTRMDQFGL